MSTLKVSEIQSNTIGTPPLIEDSAGVQVGTFCRAWVNFNGTGTVAIRASGNVSSITDLGVGLYQVNLSTAMPDINYAVVASNTYRGTGSFETVVASVLSTSAAEIGVADIASTGLADAPTLSVAIFR